MRRAVPMRAAALSAAVLVMSSAFAGCTPGSSTSTSTTSPAASASTEASPSPSPSASPTTAAAPVLPTDCGTLGTAATRAAAVGDMTLQSDGQGFVRPAPQGAVLALGCDWIVGDATGMLLLISTADAAAVTAALAGLPAEGYDCQPAEDFGVQFCQLPGVGSDTEQMIVARDGVWIYLSTVNRNGRAFLSEIVAGIFG